MRAISEQGNCNFCGENVGIWDSHSCEDSNRYYHLSLKRGRQHYLSSSEMAELKKLEVKLMEK